MKLEEYIEEVKYELTGGILQLELEDKNIEYAIHKALRELNRYINEVRYITIPFADCIDLSGFKVNSISNVYRTKGYASASEEADAGISEADPMFAQQWMIYSNGNSMYNLSDWIQNYSAYNTLLQLKNTVSTDLAYIFDRAENKIYINVNDKPQKITIEYIPVFENPEDVTSDFWQDILLRLSVAMTKEVLGRIRTRYTQSNAQWTQDGETILAEAKEELTTLRELLRTNSQITYILD